jgi:Low molecular weight phosphotyrosine protein phosphatase.
MAAAMFNSLLDEEESREVQACSAGIYAFENDPANEMAIEVMKNEYGIDLSTHRAKVLDADDIRGAWLILAMTEEHKRMILDIYPESAGKLYTLKDYAEVHEGGPSISDPFGGDYETYKLCAKEIETALMKLAEKVFDNKE